MTTTESAATNAAPAPVKTDAAAPVSPTRRDLWMRLAALSLIGPFVWALARFDVLPHVRLCLFQIVSGRPCPGCGMTRSMLRLSQGDVAGSFRMHPLGVVLGASYLIFLVGTVIAIATGHDPWKQMLDRFGGRAAIGFLVALLALWVVRAFVFPEWAPDPVR